MLCERMNCAGWLADVSDDVQLIEHLCYQGLATLEQTVSPILTTAIKQEYSVFTEGTLPFQ
jgi:hypothetical protein